MTNHEHATSFFNAKIKNAKHGSEVIATIDKHIETSAKLGELSFFANGEGFTKDDKAKMAFFRLRAAKLGYIVGEFLLDRYSGTTTAKIQTRN